MDREKLIEQVKSEYARLADMASREHITHQSYSPLSPEVYFERTLEKVIREINDGKFDDCVNGQEVVERVANRPTKAQRIQDIIESTIHNMEVAQEMISKEHDPKRIQDLMEKNERRAEQIPKMIREMKEEQAREELESGSPNVIGGGGNG